MQMLCALLVFRTHELPRPLAELSPWLDWLVDPLHQVVADLEAQAHRRFIKTHTPLDGVPWRDGVTYITVARNPLDMAVSLYHQGDNLDRARIRRLTGADDRPAPSAQRPPLREWLLAWIDWTGDPTHRLDSLPGVFHHLSDAWTRRAQPNMVLVHFDDLLDDLQGELAKLATSLDIEIEPAEIDRLAGAAGFESMKRRSDELVPDPHGVLKSRQAFFRRGRSGAAAEILSRAELDRYRQRAAELGSDDLVHWLHR